MRGPHGEGCRCPGECAPSEHLTDKRVHDFADSVMRYAQIYAASQGLDARIIVSVVCGEPKADDPTTVTTLTTSRFNFDLDAGAGSTLARKMVDCILSEIPF